MVESVPKLEIRDLQKARNEALVMDEISFTVHAGEVFVLAGVKGSGKTLISKIVVSLIKKTGGTIKISGIDQSKQIETIKKIGASTDDQTFYPSMSGYNVIAHIAMLNLREVSRSQIVNTMNLLGLSKVKHFPIARYSKSQLQLLKLAAAMVSKPELIILDDPFVDLSHEQIRAASVIIKTMADKLGTAVLLTVSSLDTAQEICDTIAIIDDGLMVQIKSYNKMIREDAAYTKISLSTPTPHLAAKLISETTPYSVALCGPYVVVGTQPANAQKVADMLRSHNVKVLSAHRVNRPMNELFYDVLKRKRVR